VAVLAGPESDEKDEAGVELGSWSREWGLVVSADGPANLAALVDGDYRFVSRDDSSGLARSFDAALESLADERGEAFDEVVAAVDGYDLTTKATESPARKVAAGAADAGLGLRATAEKLGLDFVSLGAERVRVRANPDRTAKGSVRRLATLLETPTDVADLPGYTSESG